LAKIRNLALSGNAKVGGLWLLNVEAIFAAEKTDGGTSRVCKSCYFKKPQRAQRYAE
jgi:hypothetical protein